MPTMIATNPEPKPKGPSGPPSAPMLPILGPAPDPADDIPDPVVPETVTPEPSPQSRARRTARTQAQALITALETQAVLLEDFDPALVKSLTHALRMPQEASTPFPASAPGGPPVDDSWAAHESQIHAFLSDLQGKVGKWLRDEATALDVQQDKLLVFLKDWVERTSQVNEHAHYQLGHALLALQEHGLPVLSPPYQVVVQAVSPAGYPVALTITKPGTEAGEEALVGELTALTGWLHRQGYTAPTERIPV